MYHLFAYCDYYPDGGFNDYVEAFFTPEEAMAAFKKLKNRVDGELVRVHNDTMTKTHELKRIDKRWSVVNGERVWNPDAFEYEIRAI